MVLSLVLALAFAFLSFVATMVVLATAALTTLELGGHSLRSLMLLVAEEGGLLYEPGGGNVGPTAWRHNRSDALCSCFVYGERVRR